MPISRYNGNQPVLNPPSSPTVMGPQTAPTTTQPTNNLPDLRGNTWEVGGSQGSELSPAVRERADAAVNRFNSRLRTILHHDAMSLAEGHTPVRSGDSLSEAQRDELTNAAKDMLMEMPIGALSPQKTSELRGFLERQGVSTDNLETKTLKDLGDIGADLGKQWADDFKDASPAAYYGLLGAAGAAIGTYGFLQGSEALKDIGIKPEFSTNLFNDHVKVKAEAMWGKRFENPNLAATIEGNYRAGDLRLRSNLTVDTRNLDEIHGGVGARWGSDNTYVDAQVNASVNGGIDDIHLSGRYTGHNYNVYGNATLTDEFDLQSARVGGSTNLGANGTLDLGANINEHGEVASVDGAFRYTGDNYYVRGRARADLIGDDHSVDVWAGYRPTDNMEFGLRGGYSAETGGRVGVGFTLNF